jgi:hypothetical protein
MLAAALHHQCSRRNSGAMHGPEAHEGEAAAALAAMPGMRIVALDDSDYWAHGFAMKYGLLHQMSHEEAIALEEPLGEYLRACIAARGDG